MDAPAIQDLIPHRFPFMMVDYVCKIEGSHVVGIKNLTQGEQIIRTYDDGYSVLMGAIQAEMTAQTGAIYMLSREENRGKLAYFMGIDELKFHRPVFPGQQLRLEIDMPDTKSKFGKGNGWLFADNSHRKRRSCSRSSTAESRLRSVKKAHGAKPCAFLSASSGKDGGRLTRRSSARTRPVRGRSCSAST